MTATRELTEQDRAFHSYLAATARAIAGRQGGALLLVAATFALPTVATNSTFTTFTWAYVGMLTLTSLLGLGVERLATLLVARRGSAPPASALRPLVLVRLATVPFVAGGLWLLLTFVHAQLTVAAAAGAVLWVVAVHLGVVASAGLRAVGNTRTEPVITAGTRAVQAGLLLGLGAAGANATALIVVLAAVELAGSVALMAALGPGWWGTALRPPSTGIVGWRRALSLAGIETVGLLYLRADLLLVGHLLGAGAGATYGLLYRVVDGAGGAAGTASLWLFADAAAGRDGGDSPHGVRARSLRTLPRIAVAGALLVMAGAGALGALVPRFAAEATTLRLLVAAVPLLVWNSLELHVRTARGRHAPVLRIGIAALTLNVALCAWLVAAHGLVGAAIALLATEMFQTAALLATTRPPERRVVIPTAARAAAATGTLTLLVAALS
jgi:O-antigen/teichoic acid export membrane protein